MSHSSNCPPPPPLSFGWTVVWVYNPKFDRAILPFLEIKIKTLGVLIDTDVI